MKIVLENFKCWENKTVDIKDNDLTLISGTSGAGKTSIFEAIIYALYGMGTKVCKIGSKSCKVKLEWNDYIMTRTKKTRLVVSNTKTKEVYEDAVAQEIINGYFGKNFDITGYIRQSGFNSFIYLSPAQRLDFLEGIAFQSLDLLPKKIELKNLIKRCEKNHNDTLAQLKMSQEYLSTLKLTEMKIPERHDDYVQQQLTILESYTKKQEDYRDRINELKIFHSNMQNYLQQKEKVKKSLIQTKEAQIKENCENTFDFDSDKYNHKIKEIDHKIIEYEKYKEYNQKKDKLDVLTNLCKSSVSIEKKEIEEKIQKISSTFMQWSRQETLDSISSQRTYLSNISQLETLHSKISIHRVDDYKEGLSKKKELYNNNLHSLETLKQQIHIAKLEKECYNCPECQTPLNLQKGKLVKFLHESTNVSLAELEEKYECLSKENKTLVKKIQERENKLSENECLYNQISDLEKDYDMSQRNTIEKELEEYTIYLEEEDKKASEHTRLTKRLSLKDSELSPAIKDLYKKIEKYTPIVEKLKSECTPDLELSEDIYKEKNRLIQTIEKYNANVSKNKLYNELISKYTLELIHLKDNIIEKCGKLYTLDSLAKNIGRYSEKLESITNSISTKETYIENIKSYIRDKNEYDLWSSKIKTLTLEEKETRHKLHSAQTLKNLLNEAESIAISNLLLTINATVQDFINSFFDSNFVVNLLPFKESKKGDMKPQINLQIIKNDVELEKEMLSGGEIQRIMLAFNLALSEICHTPFILLDECTSNLDSESTQNIIDGIKDVYATKKTIVMIAHQVISGVFENLIEI